jgi:hypothetical protein
MKSLLQASFSRLTFGIVLLLTVATGNAQSGGTDTVPGADRAVVKYLGAQDDMLVFNVAYQNPQGSRFVLTIRDQEGNQFYQDFFKDKAFYKQFRLPKTDKDRIVFAIGNGQEETVIKTFAVNVNSRFVQEVAIKKL